MPGHIEERDSFGRKLREFPISNTERSCYPISTQSSVPLFLRKLLAIPNSIGYTVYDHRDIEPTSIDIGVRIVRKCYYDEGIWFKFLHPDIKDNESYTEFPLNPGEEVPIPNTQPRLVVVVDC